jgi:hypothetical protein
MNTFSLEKIILMGMIIIHFFKEFSHNEFYPYESLYSFAIGTEILLNAGTGL